MVTWRPIDILDISSGGLRFCDGEEYHKDELLWFDITLEGFLSEIHVATRGNIRHVIHDHEGFHYGVSFQGLSHEKKIQIDENIRNDRWWL